MGDAPTPNWRDTIQLCRQHGGKSDCVLGRYHRGECWNQEKWDRHTPEERVAHCDGHSAPGDTTEADDA